VSRTTNEEISWQAGLGRTLEPGRRPAIVVVDFIRAFTDPRCPLGSDTIEQVKATRSLLDAARAKDVPVFFTTVHLEPGLRDAGLWLEKLPGLACLEAGTEWTSSDPRADVDPLLAMQDNEVLIVKKGASAFFGTNLASLLTALSVDTVILCGASTSGCVRATAIDLMHHGFRGLVPRDCVADRVAAAHEANLFDIQATSAEVVSSADVLQYLGAVAARDWPDQGHGQHADVQAT
jgi:maleamate amidohydrolase